MVLPALSSPRRRTEYSLVDIWSVRSFWGRARSLRYGRAFTFFAGRVRIQRLGQVIHGRKIKTDATEIVEPRQSWENKTVRDPEVLEAARARSRSCDLRRNPQPHCRIGKVGLRAGGGAGKYCKYAHVIPASIGGSSFPERWK